MIVKNLNFWTKLICFSLVLPLATFIVKEKWLLLISLLLAISIGLSNIGFKKFWRMTGVYIISITIGLLIMSCLFSWNNWQPALFQGLILAIRFSLLISFGMFFSLVTDPIEIPSGFMQARIPHKYGVTLMVAYRMMPLLSKKIITIIEAQKIRGASFKFSFRQPVKFFYQLLSLVIPLLHSTLEMSVKLSDALISRGYNPDAKITIPPIRSSFYDFCLFSITLTVLVCGVCF